MKISASSVGPIPKYAIPRLGKATGTVLKANETRKNVIIKARIDGRRIACQKFVLAEVQVAFLTSDVNDSGRNDTARPKLAAASPAAASAGAPRPNGMNVAPITGPTANPTPNAAPIRPMPRARSWGVV